MPTCGGNSSNAAKKARLRSGAIVATTVDSAPVQVRS